MSGRHHVIVIGGGRSLRGNNRSGRHHVIVIGGGSRSSNLEKTSEIAILSDGVDRDSKGESGRRARAKRDILSLCLGMPNSKFRKSEFKRCLSNFV